MSRFQIEKLEERIAPAPAATALDAIRNSHAAQGDDGGLANAFNRANPKSAVHQALHGSDDPTDPPPCEEGGTC